MLAPKHSIICEPCEGMTLTGDREKLGHVLANLLGNAVKYSREGSEIRINCSLKAGRVKVEVTDQGIGIAAADQARLFERFYRVEHDDKGHVSGFGIGLYLVSEILRLHGSEIKVRSEVGKGSTFFFDLAISIHKVFVYSSI